MVSFRSWMFVPGSDVKKIEKSRHLPVDAIIYDLEDAVAVAQKESARIIIREALQNDKNPYNVVRVNAVNTPYFEGDLEGIVSNGLKAIMLPKSETNEQILLLENMLRQAEKDYGIMEPIKIVPLIESALGVCGAAELAAASSRVKCFAFGSIDYALDIDAELTKEGFELLYARSHLVNVSRAAGIEQPIDAVYPDIHDQEGLQKETKFVKNLGFQGKLVIHPKQVDVINEVFIPSKKEIERAQLIISAYEKSIQDGLGAIQVDGQMVDVPVLERAKKILQKANFAARSV
jgi:citrate lyase subunit beta / citryl-CoA lyase